MKILIPIDSAKTGGALHAMADDLSIVNSGVLKEPTSEDMLLIDDTLAPTQQKLDMDQVRLLQILAVPTSDMFEYIMGIRVPSALANDPVPPDIPFRKNALGEVRLFKDWFLPGSEIWTENNGDEFIFYTNPAGSLASVADYLTGRQMEIIRQLDVSNNFILSVTEVQAIVATGWTQIDWNNL